VITQISDNISQHGSKPMHKPSALRPVCLLFMVVLLCSCSSGLGRVDGQIVDAGNATPLPDVIVVAVRWLVDELPMPAGGAPLCADLELTRSDAQGRFHFDSFSLPPRPLWKRIFLNESWVILTVYKHGFLSTGIGPTVVVDKSYHGIIRLERYDGSFEEQIQVMHDVEAGPKCNTAETYLAVRPLFRQLEIDATALATTPEQLEIVRSKFDLSYNDREYEEFVHPELRTRPPLPAVPVILGTAPKAPPTDKASH
jgi:hypothetical protein